MPTGLKPGNAVAVAEVSLPHFQAPDARFAAGSQAGSKLQFIRICTRSELIVSMQDFLWEDVMTPFRFALGAAVTLGVASGAALAAGDLSRQAPIELTVDLGAPGKHEFVPKQLRLETGKLYKLVLRNTSNDPHYFTSHAFSQMVFTRKVQVTQQQNGKPVTLAEFKGAIREIEVYPGQSAEWWLVPVAAGRASDLRCDIKTSDGKTHAELGMLGEIVIE
jgi:uncharacterized cupredoxin-like copper-binding protein